MRAAGRGGEGHIGFDKWTVKVPIWPSLWLFLPAFYLLLSFYYPSFISFFCSPLGQNKSEWAHRERLTECQPNFCGEGNRQRCLWPKAEFCAWLDKPCPPTSQCVPVWESRQPLTFGIRNSWTAQNVWIRVVSSHWVSNTWQGLK